jgi:hypothetical protein
LGIPQQQQQQQQADPNGNSITKRKREDHHAGGCFYGNLNENFTICTRRVIWLIPRNRS